MKPKRPDNAPLTILDPLGGDAQDQRSDRSGLGYLHSHESTSAVDGPGHRYVVWLAGCHLRCQYCHNPDTWTLHHGNKTSVEDVFQDVQRFANFLRAAGGGFTVSGGEPLVQTPFALALLAAAHRLQLHTALDTNGYLGHQLTDQDFQHIDLVLLDLKAFNPQQHQRVTGFDNAAILDFAKRLATLQQPAWVRYVLVPGLTDDDHDIQQLADFVAPLKNVQRVEILPFHQMGRPKWHELGKHYPLENTPAATQAQTDHAKQLFKNAGCPTA